MDEDAKRAATLEIGSRYLARKGLAAVTDLQAQVDRARELLTIGEVDYAVRKADSRVQAVFAEPDIAADAGTPTETIVIRALD